MPNFFSLILPLNKKKTNQTNKQTKTKQQHQQQNTHTQKKTENNCTFDCVWIVCYITEHRDVDIASLSASAQTTAALTRLKPIWNDRSISLSSKTGLEFAKSQRAVENKKMEETGCEIICGVPTTPPPPPPSVAPVVEEGRRLPFQPATSQAQCSAMNTRIHVIFPSSLPLDVHPTPIQTYLPLAGTNRKYFLTALPWSQNEDDP